MTFLQRVLAIFKSRSEEKEPEFIYSNVKCPKCKCTDVSVLEVHENGGVLYHVKDGEIEVSYTSVIPGNAVRLEATCEDYKCRHKWTIRNKKHIWELDSMVVDTAKKPKGTSTQLSINSLVSKDEK